MHVDEVEVTHFDRQEECQDLRTTFFVNLQNLDYRDEQHGRKFVSFNATIKTTLLQNI